MDWPPVDAPADRYLARHYRQLKSVQDHRPDFVEDSAEFDAMVADRFQAVVDEMADRTGLDEPACPECGTCRWDQRPEHPTVCTDCGHEADDEIQAQIDRERDRMVKALRQPGETDPEAIA